MIFFQYTKLLDFLIIKNIYESILDLALKVKF